MTVLTLLLLALLLIVGGPFLILTVGIPLLLLYWPNFFPAMFFMNWVRTSLTSDYDSLKDVQSSGRNFYLQGSAGRIGVWHILPEQLKDEYEERDMEKSLAEEQTYPVVLYNHGNSRDRTSSHRVMLYNLLTKNNFHVVTFDYRGFGDSEGEPTEDGLVEDARLVYDYVRIHLGSDQHLFVWGHSMGTGVSIRLVKEICLDGQNPPSGLILESGFNNLHDVIVHHPFAIPFRFLPRSLADCLIVSRFRAYDLSMDSDQHMRHIACPILQLHAANDLIIPVKLARRLKETAEKAGCRLEYIEFEAGRQLGHKLICTAEELPARLISFTERCK